jgi:urease accessory protein
MNVTKRLGNEKEFENLIEKARRSNLLIEVYADRQCFERHRCKIRIENKEISINMLGVPLKDGDVLVTDEGYIIILRLKDEKVISFKLDELERSFRLGYEIGNLHLRVMLKGDEVIIPTEVGIDYLLQKFKDYNPKIKKEKFIPNVEPTAVVISFADS